MLADVLHFEFGKTVHRHTLRLCPPKKITVRPRIVFELFSIYRYRPAQEQEQDQEQDQD